MDSSLRGKSVINMVHRIQNRNPGYSDFSNTGSSPSFNFSPTMSSPITHGANALKLENEVIDEQTVEASSNKMMNEQVISNQETEIESIIENNPINDYEKSFSEEAFNDSNMDNSTFETEQSSNGLENFGVEEETPDLFNSDNETLESKDLLTSESNENTTEEDDLEIPAFLRRQKN